MQHLVPSSLRGPRRAPRWPSSSALLLIVACACGGTAPPPEPLRVSSPTGAPRLATSPARAEEAVAAAEVAAEIAPAARPARARPVESLRVEPRESAHGDQPALTVVSPAHGDAFRHRVPLEVVLTDFEIESPPGNHVHVQIDDGPELAVWSTEADLRRVYEEALGRPLSAGSHVLRVSLGRADHEGVKSSAAMVTRVFHFQRRTVGFRFLRSAPMLTYARPQGCSSASERLLDFGVNVPLSADGFRVRYAIDGRVEGEITRWQAHRVAGVGPGEHTVRLWLVGADGEPVAGRFNDVTRTIVRSDDCGAYAITAFSATVAEDADDEPL